MTITLIVTVTFTWSITVTFTFNYNCNAHINQQNFILQTPWVLRGATGLFRLPWFLEGAFSRYSIDLRWYCHLVFRLIIFETRTLSSYSLRGSINYWYQNLPYPNKLQITLLAIVGEFWWSFSASWLVFAKTLKERCKKLKLDENMF